MSWLTSLRPLVYARRIARALERIASSEEDLLRIARLRYEADFPSRVPNKRAEFGSLDADAANKEWKRMRDLAEGGDA